MKKKSLPIISCALLFIVWGHLSCTDLNAPAYDKLTEFWRTPEEIKAGVGLPYAGLRDLVGNSNPWNTYALNEMTTDEIIVPIRGRDWADNDSWERLWKHTWASDHEALSNSWQFLYGNSNHSGIIPINLVIENLNQLAPPLAKSVNAPVLIAQMKTLRAFYYYLGMDLFGDIPITESLYTPLSQLNRKARTEVFAFVEKELISIKSQLPEVPTDSTYGRPTRWMAETLLAKLYLNAEIYTGKSRWSECVTACDAILKSNQYQLESDFFANFAPDNEKSKENIFAIPFDFNGGLGYLPLVQYSLHYDSPTTFDLGYHGANGFCSTIDFLNQFDPVDRRKRMFLTGQQYLHSKQYQDQVPDPANFQFDSDVHLPLNFNPVITTFSSNDPAFRMAGARCVKWAVDSPDADFAVFRLADVILMKAEAQLRNGDAAGAQATLNQQYGTVSLHSRANLPDFSLADITLDNILRERACELAWEGHRRNDLIRFGHYLDARTPEKGISENFRALFPIPRAELAKNPYLKQSPGY
ncbi:MAG TPA: RagB/SusD family nutrient uptake outer membrane protein [Cyclobacteriaceae bacterium]|nr:RagB/SusD family nutrient uptake outer membrane protein [Cyclobacteriaceae bacterium]